ncbi:hypothetical protein [Terriglobus sp. TAA 43]|uniref:hypothetical protein n=1 Tax=Terriglobus sp. TAA 43 TaxID=278961 RepID=UPI0012EDC0AE|nr:hypothetical protein [Terriglobus sp. TAA 43]
MISGSIVLLTLLFLVAVLCLAPSQIAVQRKPIAISHPQKNVTLVASLDSDRMEPRENVLLHVKMLSDVRKPMHLEVCSELPNTVQTTKCIYWTPRNVSSTLNLPVSAGEDVGTEKMTITVTALTSKKTSGLGFHQTILALGPLRVEDSYPELGWMWPAARRMRVTLKDLGVPILVAILGGWFTWMANRRAEKTSKLTSQRTEENEVRRSQFAKMQKMTQNYYTHIVGHARLAVANLKASGTDAEKEAAAERAKFHLLGLLLYNSRLLEKEGGVFFTDLDAEEVYRNAIDLIFEQIRTNLGGEQTFRPALRKLSDGAVERTKGSAPNPDTDYSGASPRFADYLAIQNDADITAWALPAANSPERNRLISALEILKAATSYEYDEPLYEHWYRKPKAVEYIELPKLDDIAKLPDDRRRVWHDLLGNLKKWFQRGGKEMDRSDSGPAEPSEEMLNELERILALRQPSGLK